MSGTQLNLAAVPKEPCSETSDLGPRDTRRLLIVVNVGWFFLSHRLPIALAAKEQGYEVHVATALDPALDIDTERRLKDFGLIFHRLHFSRSGAHPLQLCRDGLALYRLFRWVRPDVIHLVTLKPVLFGGLVARLSGMNAVVFAIPGRGSVFSARGMRAALRRWIALRMYKAAYATGRTKVIIQNVEDRDYFLERGIFSPGDVRLIRGSGADVGRFVPIEQPHGVPVVVFASRMLKEKGVAHFVSAAARLKQEGFLARFVLVGEPDHGNPHSHTKEEIDSWVAAGTVEWWGFREDMHAVFAQAHIVCLPTVYGEGVPKVLIEAAACARPIVTTDTPGCRDIVRHSENGLTVPPRDIGALCAALSQLLLDAELRRAMGRRGRRIVEAEFSLDVVVQQTLDIYGELQT